MKVTFHENVLIVSIATCKYKVRCIESRDLQGIATLGGSMATHDRPFFLGQFLLPNTKVTELNLAPVGARLNRQGSTQVFDVINFWYDHLAPSVKQSVCF